ncbi:MAG: ATPase, partial [Pseudomonadota bacterium]
LTALSDLTALSGSLLLALTVSHGRLTADAAWAASRIDEEWQIEQWGRDEEADAVAARKQSDFFAAARLLSLIEA